MIKLDLYRLLPETHALGTDEEADSDCNYTPYRIFVLESRLYPFIYKMFPNINLYIYPKSIYNPKTYRMDVYLTLTKILTEDSEELIELTEEQKDKIQDKINKITSENIDYALIDINEFYKSLPKKYPFGWFRSVLEYTSLDSSFNPFIRPEGIYLKFNLDSDYKPAYYNVCKFLKERIAEFYSKGVVVLSNLIDSKTKEKLTKDWHLVAIDEEEIQKRLFQPNWKDGRFANNPVDFLLRKIEGDEYIRIKLPDNLVKRHGIIKSLEKEELIVEGSYLKIKAENLEKARKIAFVIEDAKSNTNGRVVVLTSGRLSEIYLFFEYAEKFKKGECISYSTNSNENPYMFSCLLKENDYMSNQDLQERFRNYALDRLIQVSKITKLKNMSPHEIIEQEYSK